METLALIELLDRDGLPRQSLRVTRWPVRIGRALDCDIVLDDPHVAPYHATLTDRGDGLQVEPLPSVNGVRVGRSRVATGSARVPDLAQLRMGTSLLRVRVAGAALAPELPLADPHLGGLRRAAWLLMLALTAGLWAGISQWLDSVPGQSGTQTLVLYLGLPLVLAIWCSLWALGSKLFQRQFAFWPHLQVALFWPLVAMVAQSLSGVLAFSFSAPWIATVGHGLALAAMAVLLWCHLGIVLPQRKRAFAAVIATMLIVGGGLNVTERVRHQQPAVGDLYLSTLPPPALRVARAVSVDEFIKSAAPLRQDLADWARTPGDDGDPGDDD